MGGVSDLDIDAQNLREDFKRYSRMDESFEEYLKRKGRKDLIELGIDNEFAEGVALKYKKGRKVRGSGVAKKGIRKCKMR